MANPGFAGVAVKSWRGHFSLPVAHSAGKVGDELPYGNFVSDTVLFGSSLQSKSYIIHRWRDVAIFFHRRVALDFSRLACIRSVRIVESTMSNAAD